MKKQLSLIVGTRPNFMKAAPIYKELQSDKWIKKYDVKFVHTGQHYDHNMSSIFFQQLGIADANITFLNINKGTQNTQIANIMVALEHEFDNLVDTPKSKPDMVLVFGDVTSTLAAAITCNKMGIIVAHVEAGNRSFDRSMPEEINRILTDSLCDYHFVSEPYALDNLRNESLYRNEVLDKQHVFYVGNTMIDSLLSFKDKAEAMTTYYEFGLERNKYILVTLHRPHNVDNNDNLIKVFDALNILSNDMKIVVPVHPRRKEKIHNLVKETYGSPKNIILLEPLGYLEFMNLNINCALMLTDSGGLQEETTVLNKPCITLRPNTERYITCTHGTNYLLKELDTHKIIFHVRSKLSETDNKQREPIKYWDGKTSGRIIEIIDKSILN
jgi:UDP-N-acetylglucosamine 2-epimerase (non-hydrolysing)